VRASALTTTSRLRCTNSARCCRCGGPPGLGEQPLDLGRASATGEDNVTIIVGRTLQGQRRTA